MKELITWNEAYNLGIEEIDTQHQRIISSINKLYRAIEASTEREELGGIIEELNQYANTHLATEEKYFEQFGYEKRVEHVKAHDAYRDKIAKFMEDYHHNQTMLPFEMMDFLGEWWSGHIRGADREYIECFRSHGLK